MRTVAPAVLRARLRDALIVDASPHDTLATPVLYLQAQHDRVMGRGAAARLRATQPHMEMRRLDAPHFLFQVRPTECAHAIAAFVDARPHSGS